jgi:hypothetical protein
VVDAAARRAHDVTKLEFDPFNVGIDSRAAFSVKTDLDTDGTATVLMRA